MRRYAEKAAEWAASQAVAAGGTLHGYISAPGAGAQYASYWDPQVVRQADLNEQATKRGREMKLLTPEEKRFLDVFLHEATTAPFTGPATRALHDIRVEYGDILFLVWAYEQEVPRTSFTVGHAADVVPPLPWWSREAALQRNQEIQRHREPAATP